MSDRSINPMGNIYGSFDDIIHAITIKYTAKSEEFETLEIRMAADSYLDAIEMKDNFFSYSDYTKTELESVGIYDYDIIKEVLADKNTSNVPKKYHSKLLEMRRSRELLMYEEKNNYYRTLNGLPNIEDNDFFYVPFNISNEYAINPKIPLHKIQDYYNKQSLNKGDYYISIIEGSGYIDELIKKYPEKKYLKYIGSKRISIHTARKAKNFQIIQFLQSKVKESLISEFVRIYEQCREYFVKVIYIYEYRKFFERYDNFIAMCIMVMTIQQITMRQLSSFISRDFFDINGIRMLYEAYGIPYDMSIDEDTQNLLVKNINLLIQNKATDKVIFDIAHLLGFINIDIYRYYLTKDRRMDAYGLPIVKTTEKFNTDTGEVETVPDYRSMYDIYFHKMNIEDEDLLKSYRNSSNNIPYDEVTSGDPFWIEDQNLIQRVWETEYNYVESKYLSLGVSYSMTEIVFENVILLKMIMQKSGDLDELCIQLPRITGNTNVPIFDVVVALLCLTSSKHKLYGEIISVPTQVISVLDYIKNKEDADINLDTLHFNFNYFFHPNAEDKNEEVDSFKDQLISYMGQLNKNNTLVDTFQFNFDYFDRKREDRDEEIQSMEKILGYDDYKRFCVYVNAVSQDTATNSDKVKAINDIFANIKNINHLLKYHLTKCNNRQDYEKLKRLYESLFYSQEMSDIFTITGELTGYKRTAFTYFEFLYHRNPLLYKALFKIDLVEEYNKYIGKEKVTSDELSYEDFIKDVEYGKIFIDYGQCFNGETEADDGDTPIDPDETRDDGEYLYYYVNHIIGRLQMIIDDLEFLYMMNDAETPLETLLLRLVRFFKSYTVDIIGFDTLFVCDEKPENTIKFFDEIAKIIKNIVLKEDSNFSFSDVVHYIMVKFNIGTYKNNHLFLYDKMQYEKIIALGNEINNYIKMRDSVNICEKDIEIDDHDGFNLFDTTSVEANLYVYDKVENPSLSFNDKIVKVWYTD